MRRLARRPRFHRPPTEAGTRAASGIALHGVTKVFPGGVTAVHEVDLAIEPGEFMVLVGPSGCGKTTMLRMVCGLEGVSSGSILIGGRDVTNLAPRDRDVAMVFQSYALYPHMTVRKNLGYALKVRRMPKREIQRRVDDAARLLGLHELLERRPAQLSGGERQRVAMGRAIVREPKAFLMDEPLSNLDAKLRVVMRAELARLHERLGITTMYVTHDQVEAMTLGNRVAVVNAGQIQQVDTPQALYADPANVFVGAFIGSPAMNLVDATVSGDHVEFAGYSCPLAPGRRPSRGGRVVLGIRPHGFEDAAYAEPGRPHVQVIPVGLELLGPEANIIFRIAAPGRAKDQAAQFESAAPLAVDEGATLFTARVDARTEARQGVPHALALDPTTFHYFDPDTGANLLERRLSVMVS
jgi:multiple sugar transport system ATP-binding protein